MCDENAEGVGVGMCDENAKGVGVGCVMKMQKCGCGDV